MHQHIATIIKVKGLIPRFSVETSLYSKVIEKHEKSQLFLRMQRFQILKGFAEKSLLLHSKARVATISLTTRACLLP